MASRFQRKPLSSEKQRGIVKIKEKKFKTTQIFPQIFTTTPLQDLIKTEEPIVVQEHLEQEITENKDQEIINDIIETQDSKLKNKKTNTKKENLKPSEKEDKNNSENI